MHKEIYNYQLAQLFLDLAPNQEMNFYTELHNGSLQECYGAVRLQHFGADAVYINYLGGSSAFLIELGNEPDLEDIKAGIDAFLEYIGDEHLYIRSNTVKLNEAINKLSAYHIRYEVVVDTLRMYPSKDCDDYHTLRITEKGEIAINGRIANLDQWLEGLF